MILTFDKSMIMQYSLHRSCVKYTLLRRKLFASDANSEVNTTYNMNTYAQCFNAMKIGYLCTIRKQHFYFGHPRRAQVQLGPYIYFGDSTSPLKNDVSPLQVLLQRSHIKSKKSVPVKRVLVNNGSLPG